MSTDPPSTGDKDEVNPAPADDTAVTPDAPAQGGVLPSPSGDAGPAGPAGSSDPAAAPLEEPVAPVSETDLADEPTAAGTDLPAAEPVTAAGTDLPAATESPTATTSHVEDTPRALDADEPLEDDVPPAPTREEDEAIRAERARRFGRPSGESAASADEAGTTAAGTTAGTTSTDATGTDAGPSTVAAGTAAGVAAGSATETDTPAPVTPSETAARGADDPFEDWDDGPQSRTSAHWWGILIAVVFTPVAWYLIADGGDRIAHAQNTNLDQINVAGFIELGGGILALVALFIAARWSSVGSIIMGSVGVVVGAAFLAVPRFVMDLLDEQAAPVFDRLGQFGTNIYDHLLSDGQTGRLVAYGIVLIFTGVVSHGARRQGRREERRKTAAGLD
ncbi:hypothetical protein [Occultella gossypii]|uniref:Uncharacterized protein n=1 Tax=Occultella gossypii TaxID=2800820 RepID=A0ABS7SBS7_9MICO|nr:hypothetical protein [Occultella gossypii]MBZ2197338.1 hypothetical protein [Occultella gossypii]